MSRFGGPKLPAGAAADVTLLLEGTYPFVSGGVSSWVHQLVCGLPELRFAVVFVGGSAGMYEKIRYALPPNLVHLEEHFLDEVPRHERIQSVRGDADFDERIRVMHEAFRSGATPNLEEPLRRAVEALTRDPARHERDFLFGERSWKHICERYRATSKDRSFLEYFWTLRSMHAPLFMLARAAAHAPPTGAFHVVSTGFAGFLGVLLERARQKPLVLTEHGIYTKERRIELLQATWIKDDDDPYAGSDEAGIGFFRQTWIHFFETLGTMTYASANPIIALYEGNRERQVHDGAERSRTRVVPNGIDLARFAALRSKRDARIPPVLGLIGRVVPIKDIKTFIRAVHVVCSRLPEAEGWIVGPEIEDPRYAEECHDLVRTLGLEGKLKFLGYQNVDDIFPKIGINVLTSISEAQPLVVLEGFAAGAPCVTSDVGCCRELIEGATVEDRALGSAGAVVGIADPEATARAAIDLLTNESKWRAAQRAGVARVERYYADTTMLTRYRSIYADVLGRD